MVAAASEDGDLVLICQECGAPFLAPATATKEWVRSERPWPEAIRLFTRWATEDDLRKRGWPIDGFFELPRQHA